MESKLKSFIIGSTLKYHVKKQDLDIEWLKYLQNFHCKIKKHNKFQILLDIYYRLGKSLHFAILKQQNLKCDIFYLAMEVLDGILIDQKTHN